MKTTALWLLVAGGWLAAAQSWASDLQINHDVLPDEHGEHSATDTSGILGQPEPWKSAYPSDDLISQSWASLDSHPLPDLDGDHPDSVIAASTGVAQTRLLAADRDAARHSDIVSSLILVGLGGILLLYLRWSMAHSPHPDSDPKPAMSSSAGAGARSRIAN